jgi:restriction endonuclease Mrr
MQRKRLASASLQLVSIPLVWDNAYFGTIFPERIRTAKAQSQSSVRKTFHLCFAHACSTGRRQNIVDAGQQRVNEFDRRVRWTRQTAVLKGLIAKGERSVWSVTDAARAQRGNIRTGTTLRITRSLSIAGKGSN